MLCGWLVFVTLALPSCQVHMLACCQKGNVSGKKLSARATLGIKHAWTSLPPLSFLLVLSFLHLCQCAEANYTDPTSLALLAAKEVDSHHYMQLQNHGAVLLRHAIRTWYSAREQRLAASAIAARLLDAQAVCIIEPADFPCVIPPGDKPLGIILWTPEAAPKVQKLPVYQKFYQPDLPSIAADVGVNEHNPFLQGDVLAFWGSVPLPVNRVPLSTLWFSWSTVDDATFVDPMWHTSFRTKSTSRATYSSLQVSKSQHNIQHDNHGQWKPWDLHFGAAAYGDRTKLTLGLKWKNIGSQRPASGPELHVPQFTSLVESLKRKTEFTQVEFDSFVGLKEHLSSHSFIKVGDNYFQPEDPRTSVSNPLG